MATSTAPIVTDSADQVVDDSANVVVVEIDRPSVTFSVNHSSS